MVSYYGDFAEDDTVLIPFNTFDSNDPSASVTVTDLADADIKVHKDGGTTEIATDGATVAINFDSVTGNHLITIDTSAHADYATGSEYAVRIEGVTVDGATINAWVGAFSIERAGGALALLKGTGGLSDINTDVEAILADTGTDGVVIAAAQTVATVTDVTNGVSLANGAVTDASLAGNMEIVFETDFATNYNATRNAWATNAQDFVGTTASDPFAGKVVAASVTAEVSADVTKISGTAAAANNLEASANGIITGAAATGTLNTTTATTDLTGYSDDQLIGRTIIVTSGNADGEASDITDYASTNGTLTFTAMTVAMANSDTFVIV